MNDRYVFKNSFKLDLASEVAKLLREEIDLIDANNWKSFYELTNYDSETFGEATEALIVCGIDPLDYLDYVPENYFYKNWNIISINLPATITKIDSSAFEGCDNLESITLPNRLKDIGPWVFHSCPSLKSVTLPKTLEYIGDGNFDYCDELETINFEGSCEQFLSLIEDNTAMFKYSYNLDEISCNDGFIAIDVILDRVD